VDTPGPGWREIARCSGPAGGWLPVLLVVVAAPGQGRGRAPADAAFLLPQAPTCTPKPHP